MTRPIKIAYTTAPHNGGLVFATPERAELVSRVHRAIASAETWGEFRRLMPRVEYSHVVRAFDENCEPRPRGTDPFDPESVPGWSDGDYPPWLQSQMDRLLPYEVLKRYGKLEATAINGSFWMIPADRIDEVRAALEALNYVVEQRDDLNFW